MRFSIAFAAAALGLGARTGARADAGGMSAIPAELLRRRLDDSTSTNSCTDRAADYGTCLSGLADYEACLECVAAYEVPEGASGSSFDDCGARNTNLCAPYDSCPCLDPCLDEISAMYTCYTAAVLPSCTISCGGGGGRGSSSGGSSGSSGGGGSAGGGNSGGAPARSVVSAASIVAAVAWGILAH